MGDLHGAHKALMQCLERSKFDYQNDHLISLGDICDGWPEVDLCLNELISIKHCTYIRGNHDLWALEWATEGRMPDLWLEQGGVNTVASYRGSSMPASHREFLQKGLWWYELDGSLYVHAGFDPKIPINLQPTIDLVWQRNLATDGVRAMQASREYSVPGYDQVYIGHTPTTMWQIEVPIKSGNLWLMDTGAGHSGKLTMMNVDTKEYFQSDCVSDLYPGVHPRENTKEAW